MTNKQIVKKAIEQYGKSHIISPFMAYRTSCSQAKRDAYQNIMFQFAREKEGASYKDYAPPKVCSFNSQTFTVAYWLNLKDYEKTEFVYITKTFEYRYKPTFDTVTKIRR